MRESSVNKDELRMSGCFTLKGWGNVGGLFYDSKEEKTW